MNTLNILSALFGVPVVSGVIATLCSGYHYKTTKIPGLLFHSVLPEPQLNLSHFPLGTFEQLIHKLSTESITPITVQNTEKYLNNSYKSKHCLITFDDGLENIFHYATPVLNTYGYKATIFCVAGFTGMQSSWDVYRESRHLSAEQIKRLSDDGHEIGSHTVTHANLPFLSTKDLEFELLESKQALEKITGNVVNSLSFPHGSWNQRVWECAQEAGYQHATLYRNHRHAHQGMFPVISAGRFDNVDDCIKKITFTTRFSPSIAFSRIGSHFAKGTPLWKFRKTYKVY